MKFRPCIDLHSGQVKQIVGSTLTDTAAQPSKASTEAKDGSTDLAENFATDRPASDYAHMYQRDRLTGGHVIMLGPGNRDAARGALSAQAPVRMQGLRTSDADRDDIISWRWPLRGKATSV